MFNLNYILIILNESSIVANYKVLIADEISERSHFKIRCIMIPSEYKLEMKYIQINKELIYSYQLFSEKPLIRWDNAPHYPKLENYPHHFHNEREDVEKSSLMGNAKEDLRVVLSLLLKYITDNL